MGRGQGQDFGATGLSRRGSSPSIVSAPDGAGGGGSNGASAAPPASAGREREPNEGLRRHKLITQELRAAFERTGSQEAGGAWDATVIAKLFCPYGRGTWYITEFDGEDEFFGYCLSPLGADCDELGYASYREMAETMISPFGGAIRVPAIERDCSFEPRKLRDCEGVHAPEPEPEPQAEPDAEPDDRPSSDIALDSALESGAAGSEGVAVSGRAPVSTPGATPSRLARHIASRLWPDVQWQRKIAPGVFGFSSAGHGGVIAIVGEADLPEEHVAAAREVGLVEGICVLRGRGTAPGTRARVLSTAEGYPRERLVGLAEEEGDRATFFEAWVGEEDCDWATLFLASPALSDQAVAANWSSDAPTPEELRDLVQRNNERYLAALEPGYVPQEDGQIRRYERRAAKLAAGERLLASASSQGDGVVHVTFRGQDGSGEVWAMSNATYDAVSRTSESVTADEYRAFGEITRVS